MTKTNNIILLATAFFFVIASTAKAQLGSSGSLSIKEGGVVTIFGEHNFLTGSGFLNAGMIQTERKGEKGYLNFAKGSSWIGANKDNFIDGYVQVLHKQAFVLPIGQNGIYRPILIEGGANTSAAFYAKSPPISEIVSSFDKNIAAVNTVEYWDIQGDSPVSISLSWEKESRIADLVDDLKRLRIVGRKNGVWQIIGSTVDRSKQTVVETIKTSTTTRGVIASDEPIIPNEYEYFTLGTLLPTAEVRTSLQEVNLSVYPNPVRSEFFVNLEKVKGEKGRISIYNLNGQLMAEQAYDPSSNTVRFETNDYLNGIYELRIRVDHKEATRKFTVQRLY